MAIARFLDHICLALRASGLWAPLRYAEKFDRFLSLDCARVEGVGVQGIKFCHLATLLRLRLRRRRGQFEIKSFSDTQNAPKLSPLSKAERERGGQFESVG